MSAIMNKLFISVNLVIKLQNRINPKPSSFENPYKKDEVFDKFSANILEKEGKLVEGIMDMPANFLPEAMAPIIRFMYTGINGEN